MKEKTGECTLCRKCVGICRKTVGVEAISYIETGNGAARLEFNQAKCIACGSCVYICESGALTLEDDGDTRVITIPDGRMEFRLQKCRVCGSYWAPEKQLDYIASKAGLPRDTLDVCIDCRE
jgi:ferredoxin